jgi:hypothetical protein
VVSPVEAYVKETDECIEYFGTGFSVADNLTDNLDGIEGTTPCEIATINNSSSSEGSDDEHNEDMQQIIDIPEDTEYLVKAALQLTTLGHHIKSLGDSCLFQMNHPSFLKSSLCLISCFSNNVRSNSLQLNVILKAYNVYFKFQKFKPILCICTMFTPAN